MKVFVKTLKGTNFEIEVEPQQLVADVKQIIETAQGADVYPASKQMLIHQGKVLKDATTLEENQVAESSFIVIMLSKASPSGGSSTQGAPKSQAQPASTPSSTTTPAAAPAAAPAPAPAPALAPALAPASAPVVSQSQPVVETAAVVAPTDSSVSDVYGQAASNLVAGNNLEVIVQQILDMGGGSWDRDTVLRALRAAFNNPERAVEYLYSVSTQTSNLVAGNNLEVIVQQILDMGGGSWDRDTVLRALRAAFNNPERAVEYLYSVSTQTSNLVAGNNLEVIVQQILDMGGGSWDRDTVLRALRAAFNNPERAVEYLYSGIPEQAEVPPAAQVPVGEQPINPLAVNAPAVNPPAQAPQGAAPTGGPNANPLDLFPQGLPSVGANAGAGNLDFLRNSPQFQALRTMVQANPQILQPMLLELGKQNPHLMQLIQAHQADFLRLINEPVEGGGEGNLLGQLGSAAMPQAVTVTPEEREAIERLEAMGFDRALVLEVYFACNKNEELAANYLLDHMHEFEE